MLCKDDIVLDGLLACWDHCYGKTQQRKHHGETEKRTKISISFPTYNNKIISPKLSFLPEQVCSWMQQNKDWDCLKLFSSHLPCNPYHTSSCHFELGHMHLAQPFLSLLMRREKISNFLNVGHEKSTEVRELI